MKYRKLTGIVLKKQNYREADQIICFYTREEGKVRILGRSLRKPQSKLNHAVQDLNMVSIEVVGSGLPTLISAAADRQFAAISQSLPKTAAAFYACELLMKMTPDEHPHAASFDLLKEFLAHLDAIAEVPDSLAHAFAVKLMACLGFSTLSAHEMFELTGEQTEILGRLAAAPFAEVSAGNFSNKADSAVRRLIEFVIEREMKSEQFLKLSQTIPELKI